jgi:hypothetical protein
MSTTPAPPSLTDGILPSVAALPSGALLANTLRSRSRLGRRLLAALAWPGHGACDPATIAAQAKAPELDLEAFSDLAYALAAQPLDDGDQATALAMYDRLARLLGPAVPRRDQIAHIRLAGLLGTPRQVAALERTYPQLPPAFVRAAEYAQLRAAAPNRPELSFPAFQAFAGWPDVRLADSADEPSLLGRLAPGDSRTVGDGPLISVIMSTFRPGPELLTAVKSVLSQSWRNLELLIVDDASEDEHAPMLLQAAGLDERVQLLRQRVNGGTYRARNRAMGVAQGEFVTGLDSDDWAHPSWLEEQVAPLLADTSLVMTIADGIRCSEDLELALSPRMRLTEPRSTSIMYRAAEVRAKTGFYDTVLKSGDTEFKLRIQRGFGAARVKVLSGRNLTIVRERIGSLSHGDVSAEWVHPARFAYNCAFKHWHQQVQRGKAHGFLPASAPERPFPAPRQLLERDAVPDTFDLACAADWRRFGPAHLELLERAADAAESGADVALVHYAKWEDLGNNLVRISAEALERAAAHGLEFVDPETCRTEVLAVLDESVRAGLEEDFASMRAARIDTVPDPQAAPARQAVVNQAPRPAVGKRRLALTLAAVAAALAGIAAGVLEADGLTAAAVPAVAGLTAAGSLGALLAGNSLERAPRLPDEPRLPHTK